MRGKWRIVVVVLVVAAVGLTAVQVVRAVRGDDAEAQRHREIEREHQVAYHLRGVGSAIEPVQITYSGPDGSDETAGAPALAPEWDESVTVEPGVYQLHLVAAAPWTDLNFRLTCTVEVDGVEVARDSSYDCEVWFQLEDLPKVRASATPSP